MGWVGLLKTSGKLAVRVARSVGLRPWLFPRTAVGAGRFLRDFHAYRQLQYKPSLSPRWRSLYPCLDDYKGEAGAVSQHYFQQDLWAARMIYARRPSLHVDVGSRLDGFVGHLLVFMPVTEIDCRPIHTVIEGLTFRQADAAVLDGFADNSLPSVSSLHAVEHFGLGRYGDLVDPDACFRAMRNLARVLAPAGRLYFSTPMGRERLEFNAHRVLAPETVLSEFGTLRLVSFAAVDDYGTFHSSAKVEEVASYNYGCGLFEFTKP